MRGVKGWFVCSKNYRANDKHPRHEVSAAIKRLKEKHPEALITVEDLDSIFHADDEDTVDEDTQDEVRGVHDDSEDSDLAYWTIQQGMEIEANLSETSFINGCEINKLTIHIE